MKNLLLLLIVFPFVVFSAETGKMSQERHGFLKEALTAAYGQEEVEEFNTYKEVMAQIIEDLPAKLYDCIFEDPSVVEADLPETFRSLVCTDVISSAKEVGISKERIETEVMEVMAQLPSETPSDHIEKLADSLEGIYGEEEAVELNEAQAQIVAELPEKFSNCREQEEGVDHLIPDVLQDPLCDKVIAEVKDSGISYAMVADTLSGFSVETGRSAISKRRDRDPKP